LNEKSKASEKMKIAGLCLMSRIKKGIFAKGFIPGEFTFNREPVTDIMPLLISHLEDSSQSFSIEQDKEYQLWRIYKNPNYPVVYSFSLHDKKGKLNSSLIANFTPEGISYIIQCLFDPSIPISVRKGFINRCSKVIFEEGGHAIRNWTFTHNQLGRNEINIFKKSGYYFIERGVSFVWKKLEDIPLDVNTFFLSRIATQGIL
jgi:hypothetical protein